MPRITNAMLKQRVAQLELKNNTLTQELAAAKAQIKILSQHSPGGHESSAFMTVQRLAEAVCAVAETRRKY